MGDRVGRESLFAVLADRVSKWTRNTHAHARLAAFHAANNAVGYATHYSRSHDAVIRVYDAAGNMIETHEHMGDFKEP